MRDLSSPTRDRAPVPCIGRWILYHWTTREVPLLTFKIEGNVALIFPVPPYRLFFKKLIYLIYLFLAALGLRCCARAFSSCSEQGLLFVVACGLLIAVASLVVEHGLQARKLQ